MKHSSLYLAVIITATTGLAQSAQHLSQQPLTGDQQAIYRTFLTSYSNGSGMVVNLADRTRAFDPDDMDLKGCLKDMGLIMPESRMVHLLASELLPANGYRLVDPVKQQKVIEETDPGNLIRQGKTVDNAVKAGFGAGLLSLSEIAFSRDHHFAVFQYGFHCGSLCGNGALVVYENVNGEWKPAAGKRCSVWMS